MMLKIGDFSRLSRISVRMLRHYDDLELLKPMQVDSVNGYRYYQEEQLVIAFRIQSLKDMGFGLNSIRKILNEYDNAEALITFLEVQRNEIIDHLAQMNHRLDHLDIAIKRLKEDETIMKYNVTLRTTEAIDVAACRQVIENYQSEGEVWGLMMSEIGWLNIPFADNALQIAVFHDQEYREHQVDIEIQYQVPECYPATEHVEFKHIEPQLIASATYKGDYSHLTQVNKAIAQWISDHQYSYDGSMFCIYHVGYGHTNHPDDFVTEVCFPIKK